MSRLPNRTDAPAPRRHEILFCSDDAAIVDGFTRFIAAALNAADAAIVLVTESHRTRLLQELRTQGVDIDGAIERGTYLSFDADVAPDPVRFLEAINGVREAATKAGKAHPRVAFCGERAGRLWAAGRTAEAVQLEQLCSELAHDVDILCAYPLPYTNDDEALTAHLRGAHRCFVQLTAGRDPIHLLLGYNPPTTATRERKFLRIPIIFGVLVVLAAPAHAAQGVPDPSTDREFSAKLSVCNECHGVNGVRRNATIPVISGQPENYLAETAA